jgi:hypothetical protein
MRLVLNAARVARADANEATVAANGVVIAANVQTVAAMRPMMHPPMHRLSWLPTLT